MEPRVVHQGGHMQDSPVQPVTPSSSTLDDQGWERVVRMPARKAHKQTGNATGSTVQREPDELGLAHVHMPASSTEAVVGSATAHASPQDRTVEQSLSRNKQYEKISQRLRSNSRAQGRKKLERGPWQRTGGGKEQHSHAGMSGQHHSEQGNSHETPLQRSEAQHVESQQKEQEAPTSNSHTADREARHATGPLNALLTREMQHDQSARATADKERSGMTTDLESNQKQPQRKGVEALHMGWRAIMEKSSLVVLPKQPTAPASTGTQETGTGQAPVEYQIVEEYLPTNVTSQFAGVVTARAALVHSLNAPAVALAYEVGLENGATLLDEQLATLVNESGVASHAQILLQRLRFGNDSLIQSS
jgi:hypothetical protein